MAYTRHALSKKDKRRLASRVREELSEGFADIVSKSSRVEIAKTKLCNIYYADGEPLLVEINEVIIPSIPAANKFKDTVPAIVIVDMGAVPHILNGADVMAPGIVKITGNAKPGAIACIADEEKERIFAVGKMADDLENVLQKRRGKAVYNLHHVGDKIWREFRA